ncbi:hypothetical protein C461_01197 [Halorubrum aidingense JCM 13560]|uniref:DUF7344 domain-containing protein n=1 Tax=Halorubrum aidingense JCM 13560 TaxID=1230454 RepID=M0PKK4_9EURY|nr:hypothetical protein C461_01197 [Halorubrum aidingense JCM 13560]
MSGSDQVILSQDEAYDLLSNARRRFVISYLRSQDGPVALNELSRRLAAQENDTPVDELTDQQIKRIYVSLYQTHLPKLEEAELIEYDRDRSVLELREAADRLDEYLPTEESEGRSWQLVYGVLAGIGLLVYVVVGLVPSIPISMGQLGIAVIVAFASVSLAHYVSEQS